MKNKILLVDDNLDMLLIGQRIFSRAGYQFISARSGEEGLEKALIEKPNVIILDFMLPDMNGAELIKKINLDDDYETIRTIPIVILTARSEYINEVQDCFALGLRAFLNKPFGHRELVNIIDNIIHISDTQPPQTKATTQLPEEHNKQIVDKEWLDDLKIAGHTIASLIQNLSISPENKLNAEQSLELQAIKTSSKRLIKLLNNIQ